MTIATFSDRTATFPQTAATNAAGTAIIEARHVGKTYRAERGKELTVLRDISFTLHEGEIVAILGRSGASDVVLGYPTVSCASWRAWYPRRAVPSPTAAPTSPALIPEWDSCSRPSR